MSGNTNSLSEIISTKCASAALTCHFPQQQMGLFIKLVKYRVNYFYFRSKFQIFQRNKLFKRRKYEKFQPQPIHMFVEGPTQVRSLAINHLLSLIVTTIKKDFYHAQFLYLCSWSYFQGTHGLFLEWWNTTKSLSKIWQYFSCHMAARK